VEKPEDYRWSSAAAHLRAKDDSLTKVELLLALVPDWHNFLELSDSDAVMILKRHERTGRPLGNSDFIEALEKKLKRTLQPQKPGPKKTNI
jgi:putative transposase